MKERHWTSLRIIDDQVLPLIWLTVRIKHLFSITNMSFWCTSPAPDFQQFIKKCEHIHKRCFLWDGMDHHANWCVRSRGDGQAGHWWPEREVLLSLTFRPQAHQTDQYVKELSLKNKSSMYYIILHFKGGQCVLKDCERGCILVQLTSLTLVKAPNSRGVTTVETYPCSAVSSLTAPPGLSQQWPLKKRQNL